MRYEIYGTGDFPGLKIQSIGYADNPKYTRFGPGIGHDYIIHYVLSGKGFYNGTAVSAGQGFLILPETMQNYYPDEANPWQYVWVVSKDPKMAEYFPYYGYDEKRLVFSYDFPDAVEKIKQFLLSVHNRLFHYAALAELFLGLFKKHTENEKRAEAKSNAETYTDFAVNYIHANYQRNITVTQLTKMIGVSQPYLYKIFKAAFGKSPKAYMTEYRIGQAKQLLQTTSLSVSQIALAVGFEDPLAFSRCFSHVVHLSPSAFRKQMAR